MGSTNEFRFRWRRRLRDDREVFDAHLGRFHVGQMHHVAAHDGRFLHYSWSIPVLHGEQAGRAGHAPEARDAALALETAFSRAAISTERFNMRSENEVVFRAILGLPHSPRLNYDSAVERGEHVRPISPSDEAGWRRWLDEERRRGRREWVSPEDMSEWFGEAWQDPRMTVSCPPTGKPPSWRS